MNIHRTSAGAGVRLNSRDRFAALSEIRKNRRKRHSKHLASPLPLVTVNAALVAEFAPEHRQEHSKAAMFRMTRFARVAIIISMALHIIAFSIFTFVKLYYREPDAEGVLPVSFAEVKEIKPMRRSAMVRDQISLNRSPQNISREQAIIRPTHSSFEVFYTEAPTRVFSVASGVEREGLQGQMASQLPPSKVPQRMIKPVGTANIQGIEPPEMQIQNILSSGRDFLNQIPSFQRTPSLGNIVQKFTQIVRKKIESKKRYPLAARKSKTEGRVGVKMTILKDGRLERIEITESSGYVILDKAALESVRRAAPFPSLPKAVKRKRVQVNMYMVFRMV
jgi:TonB family protein